MREKIMKIISDVWNAKVSPVDAEDKILSLIHSEMVGLIPAVGINCGCGDEFCKGLSEGKERFRSELLSAIEKKFKGV